ncbi:hypothetical protein FG478_00170, partial [Xylella fastidiosa subsp. multiplex]|uniref:hypothetical protein n=1 Tax=Xylella fastidiosa TaxID=2371 RepID=UPI0013286C56
GRWDRADTVQHLIEHGHSITQIKGYTLAQLRAFSHAAGRAAARRQRDAAITLPAAQYAQSVFERYIAALENGL